MIPAIEVKVVYHDSTQEKGHRATYPLSMVSAINEIPTDHPACPNTLKEISGLDSVAVILIKQMESFIQCFTMESYDDVLAKCRKAGLNIVSCIQES